MGASRVHETTRKFGSRLQHAPLLVVLVIAPPLVFANFADNLRR